MTHLVPVAATLLLTAIVQGCLLAACIALTLRLLPALSAAARSVLWIATFLLMAILPFATFLRTGHVIRPVIEPTHAAPMFALALATLWAVVAAWQLVRLIRGWAHLQRIARTATPISSAPAIADLLQHTRRIGADSPVELCTSPHVQVPSVAGFFHPRILLPTGLPESVSAEDLRQIVLHEMQHLHRHDDWTNLLQKFGLALFPLNPALWYVDHRLCQERELACDDAVLRVHSASSLAYAACLTNLAEQRLQRNTLARSLSLALGAFRRTSELSRRVHRILAPGRTATPARRHTATALTAGALLAAAVTLTHTPRLVTFEPLAAPVTTAESSSNTNTHFDHATAHAVLTRATFPVNPTPYRLSVKRTPRRTHAHTVRNNPMPAPQVILLGWHPNDFSAPATTGGRPTLINYRYAAVPTPDGWLLIEI